MYMHSHGYVCVYATHAMRVLKLSNPDGRYLQFRIQIYYLLLPNKQNFHAE